MSYKIAEIRRRYSRYGSISQASIRRLLRIASLAVAYVDSGDDPAAWSALVDAICDMEHIV